MSLRSDALAALRAADLKVAESSWTVSDFPECVLRFGGWSDSFSEMLYVDCCTALAADDTADAEVQYADWEAMPEDTRGKPPRLPHHAARAGCGARSGGFTAHSGSSSRGRRIRLRTRLWQAPADSRRDGDHREHGTRVGLLMAVRLNLNLRRELGRRVPVMTEAMGRQAVMELKRRTTSYWPVRTGFSKRNFYSYHQSGSNRVFIRNRADYAVYVEARTGAARRTLRRPQNRRRIIEAGREENARLERMRRRRGRSGRRT